VAVYVSPMVKLPTGVNTAVLAPAEYLTPPVGETQGNVHVTVKLVPMIVAGAMSLVKTALMAELLGTPGVGPGMVVAGLVTDTRGRVTSEGDATVVNCQVKGVAIAIPPARLVAPVTVPVSA
jgi:hypothetical protein